MERKMNPTVWRRVCLAAALAGVLAFRFIPGAGEWYARTVYPVISYVLSAAASVFPFSLCEIFVISAIIFLLLYPVYARRRRNAGWKHVAAVEAEALVLVYVWFYWGWGMNYFRDDIFGRSGMHRAAYDEARFGEFLRSYTDSLNAAYGVPDCGGLSREVLESQIKSAYLTVPSSFGLAAPRGFQHPKLLLVNGLYSKVGVLGYLGPFFCESHVNGEVLPVQYPFTYAHELSHLLGVSEEAEANFWAYQICICSRNRFVRYSGYFGLLPYVYLNARALLSPEAFESWRSSVNGKILDELRAKEIYWDERYSRFLGSVQNTLYNWYLKGNRIPSGQKNYAEVVGMILSLPAEWVKTSERK